MVVCITQASSGTIHLNAGVEYALLEKLFNEEGSKRQKFKEIFSEK